MHINFKYCYWYTKHAYLSQATFGAELDHYLTTNIGYINQTFLGKTPVPRPGITPQLHFKGDCQKPHQQEPQAPENQWGVQGFLSPGDRDTTGHHRALDRQLRHSYRLQITKRSKTHCLFTLLFPSLTLFFCCPSGDAFLPLQHKTSRMGSIPLALFTTLYTLVISVLIICSTCFRIRT